MKIAVDSLFVEPRQPRPVSQRDRYWSVELSPGYDNIGNYFIAEALTEILDFDEAYVISTHADNLSSDAAIDFVNKNCEVLVLRGSTMLYPGRIKKWLPYEFISKIKIPIVWLGVGNENSTGVREVPFEPEEAKSLHYIAEASSGIMVRGEVTANILEKIGIKNSRILGCPTIYWSKKPQNKIQKPTLDKPVWTWREYLYSRDEEEARALRASQFRMVAEMFSAAPSASVFFQDMSEAHWAKYAIARGSAPEQFAYVFDNKVWPPRIKRTALARSELAQDISSRYPDIEPALLERMRETSFYSFDVSEWKSRALSASFIAGCRLHGNMIGLSHGIPAFFYLYDERIREVVELIEAPGSRMTANSTLPNLDELDYQPYEKRYERLYQDFKSYLEKMGLKHNLA